MCDLSTVSDEDLYREVTRRPNVLNRLARRRKLGPYYDMRLLQQRKEEKEIREEYANLVEANREWRKTLEKMLAEKQ